MSMAQTPASQYAPGQSRAVPRLLIGLAFVLTAIFVVAPLAFIFWRAFADGWAVYLKNITDPMTLHAIWLTTLVAVIVVPVNVAFGIAAAWAIARFRFPGRKLLVTLIEIPFSISPIIAGICYLLLYGRQGLLGPFLLEHDLKIMFALPGIVLVTMGTSPAASECEHLSPDKSERVHPKGLTRRTWIARTSVNY